MSYKTNNSFIDPDLDIAIIGMAGRFPGAKNLDEYWNNLRSGKESVSFFTEEELKSAGVDPATYTNPNFVKAAPILENADEFDASFFGYSPKEAKYMDPQQRLFLELSYTALEDAGYDTNRYSKPIGVFGGTAMNTYFLHNGLSPKFVTEYIPTLLGNDKDFVATKVSYKLNLTGPGITVQTACSTSLVAIHLACQSILNEECEMALAGAAAIRVPLKTGHFYQESGILTKDGHCRPFDKDATGTIFGSGGGVVLLKKLKNAISDRDNIHALIKGTAVNNDGRTKVDYTAPSVEGQSQVILEALANSGISPADISYIEAHGTGTYLGDPIEITALTKAFRTATDKNKYCSIGSVKSNIGHLDAAAGIAGLLKVVLSLKHRQIPPSINFESPNPEIDFESTPFKVNNSLSEWNRESSPRRAGISSLGIGGTNAHIILEESPELVPNQKSEKKEIFLLSTKSKIALNNLASNLSDYLKSNPDLNHSDVTFTLKEGRQSFDHKRVVVFGDTDQFNSIINSDDDFELESFKRDIVFLFPGGGSQYVNMGIELYESNKVYKDALDECIAISEEFLKQEIKQVLFPATSNGSKNSQISEPIIGLPLLFAVEYAMAKYLLSIGIKPSMMIGHSLGEYTAACIAGVLNLRDAIFMVVKRSELFQKLPSGAMTSVPLSESELSDFLTDDLSIAVLNSPKMSVVAGQLNAIEELENKLAEKEIDFRRLKISVASHSKLVEPILGEFYESIKQIKFNRPEIPFISNASGKVIKGNEASNAQYWVDHIRNTVRFTDGLNAVLEKADRVLLEVGPGTSLTTLSKQHPSAQTEQLFISSIPHPLEEISSETYLLKTLGKLYFAGVGFDDDMLFGSKDVKRVSLPTYPFERKRHWYESSTKQNDKTSDEIKVKGINEWYYIPSWSRSVSTDQNLQPKFSSGQRWLIFSDESKLCNEFVDKLKFIYQEVLVIKRADEFDHTSNNVISVNQELDEDYKKLFNHLQSVSFIPNKIVHFWNNSLNDVLTVDESKLNLNLYNNIYGLFYIVNGLDSLSHKKKTQFILVSQNVNSILGSEQLNSPEHSLSISSVKVLNKEFPNITCKNIDLDVTQNTSNLSNQILQEMIIDDDHENIGYRGNYRWVQNFEKINLHEQSNSKFEEGSVILITGGTGGIGLEVALGIAAHSNCKFILTKKSSFPEREKWKEIVNSDEVHYSGIIEKIYAIEKLGSKVSVFTSDVSSKRSNETLKKWILDEYGKIDIIIHSAGSIDDNLLINQSIESIENVLSTKVFGTVSLYNSFKDLKPKKFILFSSINSIIAPAGQFNYSAANIYLDYFAQYMSAESDTKFLSINWPGWKEVGILAELNKNLKQTSGTSDSFNKSISTADGIESFNRIINSSLTQVIVLPTGKSQLNQKLKKNLVKIEPLIQEEEKGTEFEQDGLTEAEKQLGLIWIDILGVDSPEKNDHFFKLGGSSLLAIQLISRIQNTFGVTLSVGEIFKFPTLESLGAKVEETLISDLENPELNN